jgi:hypothetical protein
MAGIFFGLAVGTKVTAALTFPLYLYIFILEKDYRSAFAFSLIVLETFIVTNPFSFIFIQDFALRIIEMFAKEGGIIFDSVDTSLTKYIYSTSLMATPFVAFLAFKGLLDNLKNDRSTYSVFLVLNVLFYLIFFTIQSRRVDRWMLPMLPIILIWAVYAYTNISKKGIKTVLGIMALLLYVFMTIHLLGQFRRWTPKSEAYLYMQKTIKEGERVYVITEEGLDPMNKLPYSRVDKFQVYTSENAQFSYPQEPKYYHYIVLSSRPMENFKRPLVIENYPYYVEKWQNFENELNNSDRYLLIKEFSLKQPNLIPLSNVTIYKNSNVEEFPNL